MIGFPQRRMAGYGVPDIEYPDEYRVFGRHYIARNGSGGFVIGQVSFTPDYPFNGGDPGTNIAYENRIADILGRTGPQDDRLFIVVARYDENPNSITISSNGLPVQYHRTERLDYSSQYASGAANGAIMREHFGMTTQTWPNGFGGTRSILNDRYVFEGSPSLPFTLDYFISRSSYARETVRQAGSLGSFTYEKITSVKTGQYEGRVARRMNSPFPRMLVRAISTAGSFWTWEVSAYTGALADGRYIIDGSGNITSAGSSQPNCEIATDDDITVSTGGGQVIEGNWPSRVATVEATSSFLNAEILTSSPATFGRNETSVGMDPIWNLYGGAVRINSLRQFSVNGSPWFNAPSGIGIFNLGDRWVCDLSGYPGTITKAPTVATLAPP